MARDGVNNYQAKFTDEQIIYIRENPDGLNTVQLAEKFGVKPSIISRIQRGQRYKSSGGVIRGKKPSGKPRISDEKRAQILDRYNAGGITITELAKMFGVVHSTAWKIVHSQ